MFKLDKKKKTWETISPEEKRSLLNHWFYYYGGTVMTLKEMDDFNTLATQRPDDIFRHIVTISAFNHTIQSNLLLQCMQKGTLDELFGYSITPDQIVPGKEQEFEDYRSMIFDEILGTFVNPEPAVPMDIVITVATQEHCPEDGIFVEGEISSEDESENGNTGKHSGK